MQQNPTYGLAVHVTPKSGRNEVAGKRLADDGRYEVIVRVTAPPEGGEANKAVCQVVAKSLGIAKGRVSVARGQSSRHKMLSVDADAAAVESWLGRL